MPSAPAQAKKAAAKKPLAASNAPAAPQQPGGHHAGKAIEDIYQKKTQLEHILLRPDTYIGSTEKQQQPLWVHDGERMTYKAITYAPGLFKIFDEILVNAADNKVRDPSMDTVKVDIDKVGAAWMAATGLGQDAHWRRAARAGAGAGGCAQALQLAGVQLRRPAVCLRFIS
jgi:DNA topoisomerase-2